MLDCFVYIRQDATQSYLEVLFYSIGAFNELQECSFQAYGYLIAKLGRERVCALVKQGVQTPGDIAGVVYKPMDSAGAWKTEILREMKSAGVVVDASKLL